VDQGSGKVLNKLAELKKDDNTLIIFISDNGAQGGNSTRLYTSRTTGAVGTAGSYEMQNSNWSQTGNAPLRSYKGNPYEGGISSPFIAWFPKKIKANTIKKGTGHIIDIAPTFYDIAGIKYPSSLNGIKANDLAGISLKPLITGNDEKVSRPAPLFWERGGNKAIRDGQWKLVSTFSNEGKYELYDIEKDRAETNDLAGKHPEIVERLKEAYKTWAAKNDVVDYNILRPETRTAEGQSNTRRERLK
jgi:arylsulfatase A-like enzyme